jgi:hypothetical protein
LRRGMITDIVRKIIFNLIFLAALAASVAHPVLAEEPKVYSDTLEDYRSTKEKKWTESGIALPAYPQDQDLLNIPLPDRDTLRLYIDERSISRLADRVIRFTLILESASGARNVFYEGIRCETQEYKTYAFGTSDGAFQPVPQPAWRDFPVYETNAFRKYLSRHVVCDDHNSARLPKEIVKLIKHGM